MTIRPDLIQRNYPLHNSNLGDLYYLYGQVKADKLCCLHLEEVTALGLPRWLSLGDALSVFKEIPLDESKVRKKTPACKVNY